MKDKKELLASYIKNNVAPILTDLISVEDLNAVLLPATISVTELNGHYEGTEYKPPKWYNELKGKNILVIDKIDTISKEEQLKFGEIISYRKVSTFELPKNCVIIITANEINSGKISEEILSITARIWGVNYEFWFSSNKT